MNWTRILHDGPSAIDEWVRAIIQNENDKAEVAIAEALSPADKRLVERYLAGRTAITDPHELYGMLEFEYEAIWYGPHFSHVNRKRKTDDNG